MTSDRHLIYLHGFTSSPHSTKARWFAERARERRVGFSCPDFNQPDFETMTVTRMIADTRRAIEAAPEPAVTLIGSSLGAFVALHTANLDVSGKIDRMILLAPALDFGGDRPSSGSFDMVEWRQRGRLSVFHYADNRMREIGYGLVEDAVRYDAFRVLVEAPTVVYQGTRDTVVDPAVVQRWALAQPNVTLHLVDDTHQLHETMGTEVFSTVLA